MRRKEENEHEKIRKEKKEIIWQKNRENILKGKMEGCKVKKKKRKYEYMEMWKYEKLGTGGRKKKDRRENKKNGRREEKERGERKWEEIK